MKNKLLILKASLLIVSFASVNAAYSQSKSVISSFTNKEINYIKINDDGVLIDIKGIGPGGPEDSCDLIDGSSIILERENNPNFDELFSMLLSAKISNSTISMQYKNNIKSKCVVLEVTF